MKVLNAKIEAMDFEGKLVWISCPSNKFNHKDFMELAKQIGDRVKAKGAKSIIFTPKSVNLKTLSDEQLEELGLKRIE